MTTFSEIHDNATGYRNEFDELNGLIKRLANEKAKGDPLVSWFRLRNRRIAQVLDPMKNELELRIRKDSDRGQKLENSLEAVKKARIAVQSNQLINAQRIIGEQVEKISDESIKLSRNSDESLSQLSNLEREIKKERTKLINNVSYYNNSSKNVDRVKGIFSSARRTKDIDYETFSSAISSINQQKNMLDIDVLDLKELPETYDKNEISSLHEQIRSVVAKIDSRYPMKLFAASVRVNRTIIHDVGNDRGRKAFTNRSEELVRNTNEAIEKFNSKYWQITGQRWERVGTNRHGYKKVVATHQKIKLL